MTSTSLHAFLHQLHDSVTAICGLTQLALQTQSSDMSEQTYLEDVIHIARQMSDHIQTEMKISHRTNDYR